MKKLFPLFLAISLTLVLAACSAPVPAAATTPTPLPGFTKTLAVGESVTATNGVDRAIELTYEGTLTDGWICRDGTMSTCAKPITGTQNFDIIVDGIKIGFTNGATVTIYPGWGQTPH